MGFKDHFSGHAAAYGRHRPTYPPELFEWLAAEAPARELAFDAGTGSGQVALALAEHFSAVAALDASPQMIAAALPHPRVRYRVAPAEESGLEGATVDLATAGQALHWFDLERYYSELRRALRPGALVAFWSYATLEVTSEIDELLDAFYSRTVGPYWPPERALVEDGYRSLPFPFDELAAPAFAMRAPWTLPELTGYLGTWSAAKRYERARGEDPVGLLEPDLRERWGDPSIPREVRFPLALRVGRHHPGGPAPG